jgi:pyrimidine-nucleoside phosphorylase
MTEPIRRHSMTELIVRKRDGLALDASELSWIVERYTDGSVTDYQMAAFLMAVLWRGLDTAELVTWTEAMLHSGEVLDLGRVSDAKIDKHSTGGVGDKVSIPLAPIVAACGVAVPMMSGRGLGHTGGTLDKLESIPGFTTALDPGRFVEIVERLGIVLAGQSETLVPADRKIYALRDATGTVESIPLISSSIMSKKLAEDLDGLVLDVKVGSGAFMKDVESATQLAHTMIGIGAAHGTPVVAVLTDMDQPLGRAVGNANEIAESLDVLEGHGPPDVTELTMLLGEEMLVLADPGRDRGEARQALDEAVASGRALEVFASVVEAQGGNPRVVTDRSLLDVAPHARPITASRNGYVTRCDAMAVGVAAVRLGAGRAAKEDEVDHGVGITLSAKRGDRVDAGDLLGEVRYRDEHRLAAALALLDEAWEISDEPPPQRPLVLGTLP